MATIQPYPGGRKDLVDRIAGVQRTGYRPAALEDWNRQQYARDVVQHPWRERMVYWAAVVFIAALGLGALLFVTLYTLFWAPL